MAPVLRRPELFFTAHAAWGLRAWSRSAVIARISLAARNRSGPISPRSNGFTNVLFGLFGPVLALVHAARAEALLPWNLTAADWA
jgi:hypothetical protein